LTTRTIDDALLYSPNAAAYFSKADPRIMSGLRVACELLRIPMPHYSRRRPPGPTPASRVALAFAADNPAPRTTTLAPRKPNATAERIAAIRGQNTGKPCEAPAAGLFDQTFPA
jgi:hypothetical protein